MNALLLTQDTPFCSFAGRMARKRFGDAVLCETLGTMDEGRKIMAGHPQTTLAILIWGDGRHHHLSNVLNMRGSEKDVFDNHDDSIGGGTHPEYDSHNRFSREEGVMVRVCWKVEGGRQSFFSYDEGEGNGMLHASVDLDFLKGFPALPWVSVGGNEIGALRDCIGSLAGRYQLGRFDIGGYHELGGPDERQMGAVFSEYYLGLLEMVIINGKK
jgi:hypothetical protein